MFCFYAVSILFSFGASEKLLGDDEGKVKKAKYSWIWKKGYLLLFFFINKQTHPFPSRAAHCVQVKHLPVWWRCGPYIWPTRRSHNSMYRMRITQTKYSNNQNDFTVSNGVEIPAHFTLPPNSDLKWTVSWMNREYRKIRTASGSKKDILHLLRKKCRKEVLWFISLNIRTFIKYLNDRLNRQKNVS